MNPIIPHGAFTNARPTRRAFLLAATASGAGFACATTDFLGGFNIISPDEEMKMGDNLASQIAQEMTIVEDPRVAGYVAAIGERLAAVSQSPQRNYQFYVIDNPSINAFAIPGDRLYVHTGLILAADTEAELASVIGHEIGHLERRHPTQRLSRAMGAQMITDLVLGDNRNQALNLASNLVMAGGISAYSRSAELEADHIAVQLLHRAGYDPNALLVFFEKLVELERQHGAGGGITLFASHPPTPDRITAVQSHIASLGPIAGTQSLVGGLDHAQAALR